MQRTLFFLAVCVIGLSGCGGGGGSSSTSATFSAFTKNSDISAGDLIRYSGGRSYEGTYVFDLGTSRLTDTSIGSFTSGVVDVTYGTGATYAERVDNSTIVVKPGDSTISNVTFTCSTDTCGYLTADPTYEGYITPSGDQLAIVGDRAGDNEYMIYGTWVTGRGTGSGTYGVFTHGVETTAVDMPTSGTVTYSGTLTGHYVTPAGVHYYTIGDISSSVNFTASTMTFAATNTEKSLSLSSFSADTSLDFSGSGTITSSSNEFTGGSSGTVGSNLSLVIGGEFFGDDAANYGGTWRGKDAGTLEEYTAAFGGKK